MYDATFWQKHTDGTPFVEFLRKGILVGVKVDKGLAELPGTQIGEQWTKGLDDLKISEDGNPSEAAIFDCTMMQLFVNWKGWFPLWNQS